MHTLFSSYSGLYHALRRGKVTVADITDKKALFCFIAMREKVLAEAFSEDGWACPGAKAWHLALREALAVAEADGRVWWRQDIQMHHRKYWEGIQGLLERHIGVRVVIPGGGLPSCSKYAISEAVAPFAHLVRVVV